MTKREEVIEKIAQTLFFNFEKFEKGTVADCNWHDFPRLRLEWKLKVEKLLEFCPELAIVDREAKFPHLNTAPKIVDDYTKYLKNNGWVKEINE